MLIVDDVLLSPARGILWIFREIRNAVEQELATEAERITAQLSDLYRMLDAGVIAEEEFQSREHELLERLDGLAGAKAGSEESQEENDASLEVGDE